MKICRVVFSTNRLEYLIPTLASHESNILTDGLDIHSILIDDYPQGRYDEAIIDIGKKYNFNEVVLHPQNKGITKNWTDLWNYLKSQDFDYIWHHEDDIIFQRKVQLQTLIDVLNNDPKLCQVNLKRAPWYDWEFNEPLKNGKEERYGSYLYSKEQEFFWTMASLYPSWVLKEPIVETEGCNLGEYPVMKYFKEKYDMSMAILKLGDGSHFIQHIGNYSQGKRVLENEPGWEKFKMYDPEKRYDSRTGYLYNK